MKKLKGLIIFFFCTNILSAQDFSAIPEEDLKCFIDTSLLEYLNYPLKIHEGKLVPESEIIELSEGLKKILIHEKILKNRNIQQIYSNKLIEINNEINGITIKAIHEEGEDGILILFNKKSSEIISSIMTKEIVFDSLYSEIKFEKGNFIRESYHILDFRDKIFNIKYLEANISLSLNGEFQIINECIYYNKKIEFDSKGTFGLFKIK